MRKVPPTGEINISSLREVKTEHDEAQIRETRSNVLFQNNRDGFELLLHVDLGTRLHGARMIFFTHTHTHRHTRLRFAKRNLSLNVVIVSFPGK